MKEIKIKVWVKRDKCMYEVVKIDYEKQICTVYSKHTKNHQWDYHFISLIFLLYTGLKDKNGKEIWEGDIVRLGNYPFTDDVVEVKWGEAGFLPFIEVLCPMYEDDDVGDVSPEAMFCEVIGNKFKNKDLLK